MRASHAEKGGRHYYRYEDRALLKGMAVPTRLILAPARLLLLRHGPIEQRLEFAPGEEHHAVYRSPYGSFALAVRTEEFSGGVAADGTGELVLRYDLFLDERFQSKNTLRLTIGEE